MDTYTVPDEIPTGLATDVTDDLLQWVGTVPNGSRLVIDKTFRVDGMFRPIGQKHLTIDGLGGRFVRTVAFPAAQVCFTHCAYIDLDGLGVTGAKPAGARYSSAHEMEHAFLFESSQYINVTDVVTEGVWGDHFHFGHHSGDIVPSHHIEVYAASCGESGRDPMSASGAHDIAVRFCDFGSGRTCMDFEPNGHNGDVTNLTVDECDFNGPYTGLFFAANAPNNGIGTVDGITITNNELYGSSLQALVGGGARRANFTVTNNVGVPPLGGSIGNSRGCLMQFTGVDGVTVTDNHCPTQVGRNMRVARFVDCTDVTYENNWKDWV